MRILLRPICWIIGHDKIVEEFYITFKMKTIGNGSIKSKKRNVFDIYEHPRCSRCHKIYPKRKIKSRIPLGAIENYKREYKPYSISW